MVKRPNRETRAGGRGTGKRWSWRAHFEIARVDHWVKNVFVLPGILVALHANWSGDVTDLIWRIVRAFVSIGFIVSSNYVINEVMDAPSDRNHPTKRLRPVPSGRVSIPLAYAQWVLLLAAGIAVGCTVSVPFSLTMAMLWMMGCLYNIEPVRLKDVPYCDVLSESINNPLRMLAGWYATATTAVPPTSLLISYWMAGCYFMAVKRYAEYREIGDPARSAAYRKSFAHYTEQRLLVSIMFYAAFAMLMFGAFIMRYRLELILSFPLVALVMAQYLAMAFKADSSAQRPETLYREKALMLSVTACAAALLGLLYVDIPVLHRTFVPTVFRAWRP